ncbi:hypothetical protein P8605_15650 [Streptomyces sp. T-3]|nr:hypothetical protein [Streptomyces sp. T-3]
MSPAERIWIDRGLDWCRREFGVAAARRPVALPTPDFFPAGFTGSRGQVDELVRRICGVMGADAEDLTVKLFRSAVADDLVAPERRIGRRTVGRYRRVGGRNQIELDLTRAGEPAVFAAIVAHELGHVRVLGEGDRVHDHHGVDGEQLTDLVTVHLGMGIFTANAAYRYTKAVRGFSVLPMGDLTDLMLTGTADDPTFQLGYLSTNQYGYALARHCLLRDEPDPPWSRHLEPGVRLALRRAMRHLTGAAPPRPVPPSAAPPSPRS